MGTYNEWHGSWASTFWRVFSLCLALAMAVFYVLPGYKTAACITGGAFLVSGFFVSVADDGGWGDM